MRRLLLAFLILCFICAPVKDAVAMDAFTAFLLSLVDFRSDTFGMDPVETYEDVDPIMGIGPKFSGVGPVLNPAANGIYNPHITQAKGQELLDLIAATGGVLYSPHSFSHLLNSGEIFFVDGGGYYEEPPFSGLFVWGELTKASFPFDYPDTATPHRRRFHLCIPVGAVMYIPPFTQAPNVKSCDKNRSLCDYVNHCTKEVKEVGDANGNGIFNEILVHENHPSTAPYNMYKGLMTIATGKAVPISGVDKDGSGLTYMMTFEDRTPPRILGGSGGDFPEIGSLNPATTGDFYKITGLIVEDNSTNKVATALALGKIDNNPPLTWETEEDWIFEQARIFDSGDDNGYIFLPNSCHGVMRYSLFAWDENGLVNPGEPLIENDKPESCYELRSPPIADLSRDPVSAQPWPITFDYSKSTDLTFVQGNLNPGDRRGEGLVHIRDNDLPNIAIRIESVKDGSKIYFPPVISPSNTTFTINESKKFESDKGLTNSAEYAKFVDVDNFSTNPYTTEMMANTSNPVYFRVFSALASSMMKPTDVSRMSKFLGDQSFIRKHLRLEDYNKSDTLAADALPDLDEETFGQRNGFGERIVALLDLPANRMIQEDVEYIISVWTDDNVKWSNIDTMGGIQPTIQAFPSGINRGEMTVEIPNQWPGFKERVVFNAADAVHGNMRVVFREPTSTSPVSSEADLVGLKFPSIEVKVEDYAGLKREIKLYVRISNENPNIRVIDRKHERR